MLMNMKLHDALFVAAVVHLVIPQKWLDQNRSTQRPLVQRRSVSVLHSIAKLGFLDQVNVSRTHHIGIEQ